MVMWKISLPSVADTMHAIWW